mmetsp:Transcript_61034/g.119690  ORF Transcript_61034/g.119690 Transcript_61034/m.119690 type:complete len:230 (+) Transcript_61034:1100-1789(+)
MKQQLHTFQVSVRCGVVEGCAAGHVSRVHVLPSPQRHLQVLRLPPAARLDEVEAPHARVHHEAPQHAELLERGPLPTQHVLLEVVPPQLERVRLLGLVELPHDLVELKVFRLRAVNLGDYHARLHFWKQIRHAHVAPVCLNVVVADELGEFLFVPSRRLEVLGRLQHHLQRLVLVLAHPLHHLLGLQKPLATPLKLLELAVLGLQLFLFFGQFRLAQPFHEVSHAFFKS